MECWAGWMIPGPGGTAWLPMSRSIPYAVPPGLGILIYASTQHFGWGFHLGASGAAQCSSASLAEHHAHALAPALVNRHEVPIDLG